MHGPPHVHDPPRTDLVVARLYEGVVVAAHLKDAGRDTPELREQLRALADASVAIGWVLGSWSAR